MLDDANVVKQRDGHDALGVAATIYQQAALDVAIQNSETDGRAITQVIVAGMGGSALAADMARVVLRDELKVPFEVVRDYTLPGYANKGTLVIVSSFSGNTEETVACMQQALQYGCEVAVITSGGKLKQAALEHNAMLGLIPPDSEARYGMVYNLRILLRVLAEFNVVSDSMYNDMAALAPWLQRESELWAKASATDHNYAKQLALLAVGKTPVFYAGPLMAPVAYKWKISWNENAKNVAMWNVLPEFSHNEFVGWSGLPVEKPFAVFDLVSELEHPRVLKRLTVTDTLLSGKRPKATVVPIAGETVLAQLLWGVVLGEFVSIYVAVLNNIDPTPVALVDKMKAQLG